MDGTRGIIALAAARPRRRVAGTAIGSKLNRAKPSQSSDRDQNFNFFNSSTQFNRTLSARPLDDSDGDRTTTNRPSRATS
jgi:hypothetical protein